MKFGKQKYRRNTKTEKQERHYAAKTVTKMTEYIKQNSNYELYQGVTMKLIELLSLPFCGVLVITN